ncbi:MAG: hypothetical protein ACFCUE_06310 [Candidatus Bathyarchaeia archaeon]|jgi:Holliday junction resolvase
MMLESSKKIGKYENPLMQKISGALSSDGYDVLTHVRLNIAWSNVISDIDVIAISEKETIIMEVKSSHDNFYKAFSQLKNLEGFADKLYIATDKPVNTIKMDKWVDESIGLICVEEKKLKIIKPAKYFCAFPKVGAISQLRKKCLFHLANLLGVPAYLSKAEIENRLVGTFNSLELKMVIKQIVLCEGNCEKNCILIPNMVASGMGSQSNNPLLEVKKLNQLPK